MKNTAVAAFVAMLALVLITSAARAADVNDLDIAEGMRYESFQNVTPLDATTQMVSADTQVRGDMTVGSDYTLFGRIGRLNGLGKTVFAEGANVYTAVGFMDLQATFVRQDYSIVTRDATGESWTSHHADITKLKWVPPRRLLHLPMNGRLAFGNAIYRESAEQGGVKFTQPFAAFDVEYGRARINIGANRLRGDLTSKTGGFGSFEYEVNPHLVMYADYDDFDFHKVVINNVILPRTDVDCSACDNRAFTIGLSARVGDMGVVHFGMYDINDLKAPTGSLSLKREF